MRTSGKLAQLLQIMLAASLLVAASGCKKQAADQAATATTAAPTDQQMSSNITSRLNTESALSGQPIQVAVDNGRATLSGTVTDEASRSLAANDAASVDGVKTVINNLTVRPARSEAPAMQEPAPRRERTRAYAPAPAAEPPAPVHTAAQRTPEPVKVVNPPAPPKPVTRTVTVPSGTTIPVRLTEALETGKTQPNSVFHASLAGDLIADGVTAIPRGASVLGRVIEAKDATHYTGNSVLTLELTQITANGQTFHLVTDPYTQQGKGRGKNTAEKVGGGAAIGALIGALAGGGKGAAIGAATGGGVGAGANTITRGEQVKLPSESMVNFRLQNPISVTTTTTPGGQQVKSYDSGDTSQPDPTLQQR
ncbi:MAG TPA: BON domain-containing protein [Acidisarcina sp.]|nr:BON domain-containing protein [Acidisarcina sp.]